MDRFSKSCLVLIVILLTVIALRPLTNPQTAVAAEQYEYKVVLANFQTEEVQSKANELAAQGWELLTSLGSGTSFHGAALIFRKEK